MKEKETIHLLLIDDNVGFVNELADPMREDYGYKETKDKVKFTIRTNNSSRSINHEEMYKHLKDRKLI